MMKSLTMIMVLITAASANADLLVDTYVSFDGGGEGDVFGDMTGVREVTLLDTTETGDMWMGGDQFQYLHTSEKVTGDFSAIVRIVGQTGPADGRWGKAGIRASTNLCGDSSYAMAQVAAGNGSQSTGQNPVPVRLAGHRNSESSFETSVFDSAGFEVPNNIFASDGSARQSWLRLDYSATSDSFVSGSAVDVGGEPGEWAYSTPEGGIGDGSGFYVGLAYSAHSDMEFPGGLHGVAFDNLSIDSQSEFTGPFDPLAICRANGMFVVSDGQTTTLLPEDSNPARIGEFRVEQGGQLDLRGGVIKTNNFIREAGARVQAFHGTIDVSEGAFWWDHPGINLTGATGELGLILTENATASRRLAKPFDFITLGEGAFMEIYSESELHADDVEVKNGGELFILGGTVRSKNFTRRPGSRLLLFDGTIEVDGGNFVWNSAGRIKLSAEDGREQRLHFKNGATVSNTESAPFEFFNIRNNGVVDLEGNSTILAETLNVDPGGVLSLSPDGELMPSVDGSLSLSGGMLKTTIETRLRVEGNASLQGDLELAELPASFDNNDTFVLLLAESLEGQFTNVGNGGRLAIGEQGTFAVNYTPESVEVTGFLPLSEIPGDYNGDLVLNITDFELLSNQILTESSATVFDENKDLRIDSDDLSHWITELAKPIAGDVDFDGTVAFSDFLVLSANFGASGNWMQGDFDDDGLVAFPDFLALSANFGQSATRTAAVPEPSSILLVFWGCIAVSRRQAA